MMPHRLSVKIAPSTSIRRNQRVTFCLKMRWFLSFYCFVDFLLKTAASSLFSPLPPTQLMWFSKSDPEGSALTLSIKKLCSANCLEWSQLLSMSCQRVIYFQDELFWNILISLECCLILWWPRSAVSVDGCLGPPGCKMNFMFPPRIGEVEILYGRPAE